MFEITIAMTHIFIVVVKTTTVKMLAIFIVIIIIMMIISVLVIVVIIIIIINNVFIVVSFCSDSRDNKWSYHPRSPAVRGHRDEGLRTAGM